VVDDEFVTLLPRQEKGKVITFNLYKFRTLKVIENEKYSQYNKFYTKKNGFSEHCSRFRPGLTNCSRANPLLRFLLNIVRKQFGKVFENCSPNVPF